MPGFPSMRNCGLTCQHLSPENPLTPELGLFPVAGTVTTQRIDPLMIQIRCSINLCRLPSFLHSLFHLIFSWFLSNMRRNMSATWLTLFLLLSYLQVAFRCLSVWARSPAAEELELTCLSVWRWFQSAFISWCSLSYMVLLFFFFSSQSSLLDLLFINTPGS